MKKVIITMKNAHHEHDEDYDVEDNVDAREYADKLIAYWNSTLNPGDLPREVVSVREELITANGIDDFWKHLQTFRTKVHRECGNAFGSAWCKNNEQAIQKAYNHMIRTGYTKQLKDVIRGSGMMEAVPIIESPVKKV